MEKCIHKSIRKKSGKKGRGSTTRAAPAQRRAAITHHLAGPAGGKGGRLKSTPPMNPKLNSKQRIQNRYLNEFNQESHTPCTPRRGAADIFYTSQVMGYVPLAILYFLYKPGDGLCPAGHIFYISQVMGYVPLVILYSKL